MINRFLDPANVDDVKQLNEILDLYLQGEFQRTNPIYAYKNQVGVVTWIKDTFNKASQNDFIITGQFINGRLEQIFVAYKLEVVWGIKESYWPYWCVGLVYFRETSWATPADKILSIEALSTSFFEAQGYHTGYMVIKAPKGLVNMTDFSKADEYIDKVFTKTIPGLTHNFRVEQIFRSQQDLDSFKFKGLSFILPKSILGPVVLLSFTLKHQYRLCR
jgi:hypothetical protein